MKLISMRDFVLEQDALSDVDKNPIFHFCRCIDYANFLKQPLTLGMFVPCDDGGNVLKEINYAEGISTEDIVTKDGDTYYCNGVGYDSLEYSSILLQAKERVLFENFELDEYGNLFYGLDGLISNWKDKPIEQLLHKDLDITLTPTAIKQIGL